MRRNMKKTVLQNGLRSALAALLVCLLLAGLLAGCAAKRGSDITSVEQLNDPEKKIGVCSDTAEDRLVARELPLAKVEYVKDEISAYTAVSQGKLDAFVYDRRQMELAIENGQKGVRVLDVTLGEGNKIGVGISPLSNIPDLEEKINAFLDELRADGTLDDMQYRWLYQNDWTMPEIPVPEKSPLHLTVGTTGSLLPYSFYVGTSLSGRDIELARRFAAWLGAELELKIYDFDGIVSAAQGGDVDCIMSNIFVTPEREESIPFSEPVAVVEVGVLVRDTDEALPAAPGPEYTAFSDLSGRRVSMLTGEPSEGLVRSKVPDVGEFSFFNNMSDIILALRSDKTDAILMNNAMSQLTVNRNPDLALFPQSLQDGVFGIAFQKGDPARDAWQAAFDAIPEETKQSAWEKWTGSDESAKVLPEQDWPGLNGTVQVAACDTLEPMSYAGEGGEIKGFDIEMILLMAKEMDVHVRFIGMEFSAVLSYVQAGKALMGAGSIIITEERLQSVDFVEYYPAAFVLVVRTGQGAADDSLRSSITSSFEKTFVRENRWRLFVSGIGTTLLITVLSILFGTTLGFGVFMLCRRGNPIANTLTRFFVWLVNGMPVVVLLMILYYIIFGRVAISGAAVSVVGFTLCTPWSRAAWRRWTEDRPRPLTRWATRIAGRFSASYCPRPFRISCRRTRGRSPRSSRPRPSWAMWRCRISPKWATSSAAAPMMRFSRSLRWRSSTSSWRRS